jgi:hypothetical protein
MRAPLRVGALAVAFLTTGSLVAACSNGSSPGASGSSGTSSTAANTTVPTPTTTGTLLPQSPTRSGFYSPTRNISCEIDVALGPSSITQAGCLTLSPARAATLSSAGKVTVCSGVQCLGNAAVNTPTLGYGTSITLGPFTCVSTTTAMRCARRDGQGFAISAAGVTPIGGATTG